jgi:hypothetical protein
MTVQQKNYLKSNWMTLANLILLLTLSFRVGFLISNLENGINKNKVNIIEHKQDFSVHMPFEKKIEVFVPRVELDGRIENIEKSLIRIEKKLDK